MNSKWVRMNWHRQCRGLLSWRILERRWKLSSGHGAIKQFQNAKVDQIDNKVTLHSVLWPVMSAVTYLVTKMGRYIKYRKNAVTHANAMHVSSIGWVSTKEYYPLHRLHTSFSVDINYFDCVWDGPCNVRLIYLPRPIVCSDEFIRRAIVRNRRSHYANWTKFIAASWSQHST